MAKKAYGGVNDMARNGTKLYGGVNGVARKIIKGYCGVNGVARQFWPAGEDTQDAMSFATSYAPGGIYELDVCYPIAAISYAIKEACKINKAYYKDRGVYSLIKQYVSTIITHFLSVKGDANVVRIYIESSSYNNGNTYITVCYGKVDNLTREVSNVLIDTTYGIKYATLTDDIYLASGFTYAFSQSNHTVRSYTSGGGYISRMGLYVSTPSGSYGEALTILVTNLGMVNYNVSMIYDWYWNLDSLEQPMVDRVDGLIATKYNEGGGGTQNADINSANENIVLPSFLWAKGRTIQISLGEMDRYYDERTWESQTYREYPKGWLFGIFNTAGYGSQPGTGFYVTNWTTPYYVHSEQKSKIIGQRNYGSTTGSELANPNQLSNQLLTIYFDEDKTTLSTSGNLACYIDEAPSLVNRYPLKVGRVIPGTTGYEALYKFKVRSIAVY